MAILEWINGRVLGVLTPLALCFSGVFFLVLLRAFPLLHPQKTLLAIRGSGREETLRALRGLCMALSGTLGVGNIAGVALAIGLGGAGSVFWMWISAALAMFLKYAEIVLALVFRGKEASGAMAYMKVAFGKRVGGIMAGAFGALCLLSALLLGSMLQANAIAECAKGMLHIPPLLTGIILCLFAAPVIVGGAKSISRVTSWLIPLLTLGYFLLSLFIVLANASALPSVFARIFRSAFSPAAASGGILGFLCSEGVRYGVARGLLSNEAGCGTAPLAHAEAKTSPVGQGVLGMVEVFVDTMVLCTVTAVVILLAFEELPLSFGGGILAIMAYGKMAGSWASYFVGISLILFAYGTVICWAYYGERSALYLSGGKEGAKRGYFALFCLLLLLGCLFSSSFVWGLTDSLLSLMTLLNVSALLRLSPTVFRTTQGAGIWKTGKKREKNIVKSTKKPFCRKKYL